MVKTPSIDTAAKMPTLGLNEAPFLALGAEVDFPQRHHSRTVGALVRPRRGDGSSDLTSQMPADALTDRARYRRAVRPDAPASHALCPSSQATLAGDRRVPGLPAPPGRYRPVEHRGSSGPDIYAGDTASFRRTLRSFAVGPNVPLVAETSSDTKNPSDRAVRYAVCDGGAIGFILRAVGYACGLGAWAPGYVH